MAFPQMKLDNKSPLIFQEDENVYQAEIGNDRVFDKRKVKSNRPISAKVADKQPAKLTKATHNRPSSASRQPQITAGLLRHRSKQITREADSNLLAKLKPRSILADKERLFEENLALKMLNNHLLQENTRLKTRLNQLDREIGRRDDLLEDIRVDARGTNLGVQKTHLVTNLKQTVRELRQELTAKQEEIALLRRNLKSTKIGELEVEIQVYVDECTRLRHHLEELLKQRDESPIQYGNPEDQNYQQSLYNSNLQKELEALSQSLQAAKEDANRWKQKAHEMEKTKQTKRAGEVKGLRTELQKLRAQMDSVQEQSNSKIQEYEAALAKQKSATSQAQEALRRQEAALKDKQREVDDLRASISTKPSAIPVSKQERSFTEVAPPPPVDRLHPLLYKFFTRLRKILARKRILLTVFLSLMDKNNNGYVEISELFKGLKQNKAGMKLNDLAEVVKIMGGVNSVSIRAIEAWNAKYNYVNDVSSETSEEEASPGKKPEVKEIKPEVKEPEVKAEIKQIVKSSKTEASEEVKNLEDKPRVQQTEISRKDRPTSAKPTLAKSDSKAAKESNLESVIEEPKHLLAIPVAKEPDESPTKNQIHEDHQAPKKDLPPPQIKEIPPPPESPKPVPPPPKEEPKPIQAPVDNIVTEAEVKPILQHVALRGQLHRVQKQEIAGIIAKSSGKPSLKTRELIVLLSAQPFALTEDESSKLAKFLLQKKEDYKTTLQSEAPSKDIAKRLFEALDNWSVLAEEDEERYDRHIAQIVLKNQISIKQACKLYDDSGTGIITFKDFMLVVEELELEFSPSELKYMQLLFYSHSYELNKVPYKQFLQAYSKMHQDRQQEDEESYEEEEEDGSLDEETRAAIVRDKLEIISQVLIQKKQPVYRAFKNTDGLIYPQQLLDSLRSLGIPDFDKEDFVIFIEGLQCEEEDELCISLDYLEELLAHYGVKAPARSEKPVVRSASHGILEALDSQQSSKGNLDSSRSRIKKVSMLESPDNFEYSDDSPPKLHEGGGSDASPFSSLTSKANRNSSRPSEAKLPELKEQPPPPMPQSLSSSQKSSVEENYGVDDFEDEVGAPLTDRKSVLSVQKFSRSSKFSHNSSIKSNQSSKKSSSSHFSAPSLGSSGDYSGDFEGSFDL